MLSRPRSVILTSASIAIAAIVLLVSQLEYRASRMDLLDGDAFFHRQWLDHQAEFGGQDEIVIVTQAAGSAQVIPVLQDLGQHLRLYPDRFEQLLERLDTAGLRRKGLHFLSESDVRQIDEQLMSALTQSASHTVPAASVASLHHLRQQLPQYILLDDGRMGLITLKLAGSADSSRSPHDIQQSIETLRQILEQVQDDHPEAELGLTGIPIIDADEMATSQTDMMLAGIVSLVGVLLVFSLGFGRLLYPLLASLSLLVGLCWTCGYLTIAVGHLNILSMSFGAILLGLGIDFAIHYIARFASLREQGTSVHASLLETGRSVGPAICAGGLTTAVAFFSSSLTQFAGVSELGIIAGGGILLCVLSTLIVLPALISTTHQTERPTSNQTARFDRPLPRIWNRPLRTAILAGGLTALTAFGMTFLRYDQNLLNLQAKGISSVEWERRLLRHGDHSVWFAVASANTLDEMHQLRQRLLELETVERVEDLSTLLAASSAEKCQLIAQVHERLGHMLAAPKLTARRERRIGTSAYPSPTSPVAPTSYELEAADPWQHQRLGDDSAEAALAGLQRLYEISDPTPPQIDDLPPALREQFVGQSGKLQLRIFAKGNLWDDQNLARFVNDLRTVTPLATGPPIHGYYASRAMYTSYLHAAVYSSLGVILILWWTLRNWGQVLLAATPTVLGMLQLLGLMGWLGIPLNPANIIVLPLIIGIGIDDGIHVVNEMFRSDQRQVLHPSTVSGLVLTSLTSMVGFGSLMVARHEGLRSLGRVTTLGIACCLVTSVVLLPCLIRLIRRPGVQ